MPHSPERPLRPRAAEQGLEGEALLSSVALVARSNMASRHFIERTFQNGLRLGLDALGHDQPRGPTHPTVITRDPPRVVTPPSPSRTRVRSSSICSAARLSNSRRPSPNNTGTTWSSNASRRPAASPSCATAAPWPKACQKWEGPMRCYGDGTRGSRDPTQPAAGRCRDPALIPRATPPAPTCFQGRSAPCSGLSTRNGAGRDCGRRWSQSDWELPPTWSLFSRNPASRQQAATLR
jgi:hypothetical protein